MMFRGVIQEGRVVMEGEESLPEGTRVNVSVARRRSVPRSAKKSSKRAPKPADRAAEAAWKNRTLLSLLDHAVKVSDTPTKKKAIPQRPRSDGWLSLLDVTVKDDDLPRDLAHQHDHYIYGTPKRPAWKPKKAVGPRLRRKA